MSSVTSRIFVAFCFFIAASPAFLGTTPEGDLESSEHCAAVAQSPDKIYGGLEEQLEKAVILLGNNGVGKSTLVSLLIQEKLLAKICMKPAK